MKPRNRITPLLVAAGLTLVFASPGLGDTRTDTPLSKAETEASITRATARLLASSQLAHRPLDDKLAGEFLDGYLDMLDGTHSLFLQSDLREFAATRTSLAYDTLIAGDTRPAHAIFARYLERLAQQVATSTEWLRTAKPDFTGHDVYSYDREHANWPRDLKEAQSLWRQQLRAEVLQAKLAGKKPAEIVRTLIHRRQQQLAMAKALDDSEVLEIYLNALAHVYDPHSDYLGHEALHSLNIAMRLSLFGIGASLENQDGFCQVHELIPGGPAARSGLINPGDRILSIAQDQGEPVDIGNLPLTRVVELIRGPKGTRVSLSILPAGAAEGSPRKTITLVRDRIDLEDQRAKASIIDLPTSAGGPLRIGVVRLPSFYADLGEGHPQAKRSATADVATLLAKLKAEHVRGIVLDLRGNGGGSLDEAVNMTGLFIKQGPVVQTRDLAGQIEIAADRDPSVAYDGPLVVLTNRFSASASEILAGALKDYGRAVVVGDTATFGKGTVQSILPLRSVIKAMGQAPAYDPGALKVSFSKFYRPNGASTQLRGVASDIVLPSPSDVGLFSESTLKNPLPWDAVSPAPHDRLNLVAPYLATLRERSASRSQSDSGLIRLADEEARLKKRAAEKSISLNEAERRQELALAKSQEKEAAREGLPPDATIYEITVQNAGRPGLPAPWKPELGEKGGKSRKEATPSEDEGGLAPGHDVILRETTRILADYIGLVGQPKPLANLSHP